MKQKENTKVNPETQTEKPRSKGAKIALSILNVFIIVLIVLILLVSVLVATMALTSKADPTGLPNLFGYTVQYVQTNSMDCPSPEGYQGGNFSDKDVIIGRKYTPAEFPEFELGDVITYNSHQLDSENKDRLITHRIVDIEKDANGNVVYQTWGDNRDVAPVPDQEKVEEYLQPMDIVAVNETDKYHGGVLKGFADFFRLLRSQLGFFLIVLMPMIIFFIYAIVRVVISAMNYKKGKEEEEKQEAVDQAVAAALAEKDKENAGVSPENMTPEQMEQFKQFLAQQEAQKADAQAVEASEDAPADESPEE